MDFKKYSAKTKRTLRVARGTEEELGPLELLPGTWANVRPEHRLKTKDNPEGDPFVGKGSLDGTGASEFDGRGWNLIALPFFQEGQRRNYRLLMNQYNEVLSFTTVDDEVPNRGLTEDRSGNADQRVAALDYTQMIKQIKAEDFSDSGGLAGDPELPIHHEPGFFLHMKEQTTNGFDIARLATIPHGNSATALGRARPDVNGLPTIPDLSGFPEGVGTDIEDRVARATGDGDYLRPYNHYTSDPFKGVVTIPGFPGFSPENANNLLQLGLSAFSEDDIESFTELPLETDVMEGGITNIPFVERQADAAVMRSTFWILKLKEKDENGDNRLVMLYSQFIFLDFFNRFDGRPGLIRWPHISINMMEKVALPSVEESSYPVAKAARKAEDEE